jgi:two-component system response regulator PilR (NtrC family)
VGSTAEVPFEARLLAATNKRLDQEVKAGHFREDLFYRLNVITIELPPLRDRAEDIPELAEFFLSRLAEDLGRPGLSFSADALAVLRSYAFPGNVRQLQNIVERAATLAESDVLGPRRFPPRCAASGRPHRPAPTRWSSERPSRWRSTWTRPSGATCSRRSGVPTG